MASQRFPSSAAPVERSVGKRRSQGVTSSGDFANESQDLFYHEIPDRGGGVGNVSEVFPSQYDS